MEKEEIINWGIIGCGNVTEVKSGPAFNKVDNSTLYGVMRRNADKAADYANRHQVPVWYSDANELINDPNINAIYLATPPKFHELYAIAAMEKGKAVYVEKPVTLHVSSCKRMIDAVKMNNGKLTVAHYRRALPMFLKVKEMVDQQLLGQINRVDLKMLQPHSSDVIANLEENWRVVPSFSGGGYFYDLAPHQLDILIYIFGDPLNNKGISINQSAHYTAEDAVSGSIDFINGIQFKGSWNFNMPDSLKEDSCKIIGERGYIEFPFFGNQIKVVLDGVEEVFVFQPPQHIQQPMIEQVVHYFLGKAANPCPLEEAIKSLEVMETFVYGQKDSVAINW